MERTIPHHESALSRMTTSIPIVKENSTIGEVQALFKSKIKNFETLHYIYVVNSGKKLVGVFSIKKLFQASTNKKINELMEKRLVVVHPHTHQETVALLAIHHNLRSIPVVDKDKVLLGAITPSELLSILHKEHIENALRAAGIHKFNDPTSDIINASALTHFQKRLPWLVLGLFGGILAAFIVGFFEKALEAQLVLAAFIPTVVYISDAVGTQTETLFIRSLDLQKNFSIGKYLLREIQVIFLISLVLSLLNLLISFLWLNSLTTSLIVAASIFFAILVAATVAVLLPWFFYKFKIDPAFGSGPFSTIITDVLSLFIYFSVASFVLGQLL